MPEGFGKAFAACTRDALLAFPNTVDQCVGLCAGISYRLAVDGVPNKVALGSLSCRGVTAFAYIPQPALPPTALETLAAGLQGVWSAPTTDARLKKRIVRTLIHEAIADLDEVRAEIVLTLHWVGGAPTEHRLPRRRRGQRTSTAADVIEAVHTLALIARDDVIAGVLNRNSVRRGHGNRFTRERVIALRSQYRIPVFREAAAGEEPWLNLTQAAARVGVAARTLRLAAERGEIDAAHPLADGPWVFSRAALDGPAARVLAQEALNRGKHPAVPHPAQQSLFASTT